MYRNSRFIYSNCPRTKMSRPLKTSENHIFSIQFHTKNFQFNILFLASLYIINTSGITGFAILNARFWTARTSYFALISRGQRRLDHDLLLITTNQNNDSTNLVCVITCLQTWVLVERNNKQQSHTIVTLTPGSLTEITGATPPSEL